MDISTENPSSDDFVIALMGPTGVGKSHFIDILTRQSGTSSASGLDSCTDRVRCSVIENYVNGLNLMLVDTPGFDDTSRADLEILGIIGKWLENTYRNKIKLTGILYLHRITDNRVGGGSLKDLRMFGELCGDAAMSRVTLVTTMWDRVQDCEVGESRERELKAYFWNVMLDNGSKVARFSGDFTSAKTIVDMLIAKKGERETLLLQEELVDLKKRLNETSAGRMLYNNLRQLLDEQKASMQKLVDQSSKHSGNPHFLASLQRERKTAEEELSATLDNIQRLKIPLGRRLRLLFMKKGTIRALSVNPQPTPQDRLLRLTLDFVETTGCKAEIMRLCGDDAQCLADYLNDILHETKVIKGRSGKYLLDFLCGLAKSANVYPQCYNIRKALRKDSQPMQGGGFADVYKGRHGNHAICLKVIRVFQKQDCLNILRVHIKETILWAHLVHPNILPFYGVYVLDEPAQRFCLVSPWMESGNISDHLKFHPMTPREPLILDIIEGLSYLHQLDIIHGDLKAQNVLLSDEGRALITDFGLSSIAMTTAKLTPVTFPGGTIRWTAPELLKGDDDDVRLTKACDVWSFGCLCYEVITRKIPFFQYSRELAVVAALQRGDEIPIRPPAEHAHDEVDDQMWSLMVDCWQYEPQNRSGCPKIRELLATFGCQDSSAKLPSQVETSFDFRQSMKTKSGTKVDHERIERILTQAIQATQNERGEHQRSV